METSNTPELHVTVAPRWVRWIDYASLGAFACALAVSARVLVVGAARLNVTWVNAVPWVVLIAVVSWLMADALSGLIHYLADNFGSPHLFILGPALIRPFREHHSDPESILRHDFVERSGSNALGGLLLFGWVPWSGPAENGFALGLRVLLIFTGIWVLMTSEIHAWSHQPLAQRATQPPRIVRLLQNCGIVLDPFQHARHHQGAHQSHYCITSGYWDRVKDAVRRSSEQVRL